MTCVDGRGGVWPRKGKVHSGRHGRLGAIGRIGWIGRIRRIGRIFCAARVYWGLCRGGENGGQGRAKKAGITVGYARSSLMALPGGVTIIGPRAKAESWGCDAAQPYRDAVDMIPGGVMRPMARDDPIFAACGFGIKARRSDGLGGSGE